MYSKIQFFCSMVQTFSVTNQPHDTKLKIGQLLLLYKLSLLITLSTLSCEFVSNCFLLRKLHISHVTQSDDMVYHLLSWAFSNLCFIQILFFYKDFYQ